MTSRDQDRVVSLMCARFEDALAEGELDASARAHMASCASCATLAGAIEAVEDGIAAATAPRDIGAGFVSSILDRALGEEDLGVRVRPSRIDAVTDELGEVRQELERQRAAMRRWRWAGVGVAAGIAAAAFALTLGRAPTPTAVERAPQAKAPPTSNDGATAQGVDSALPTILRPSEPAPQDEPRAPHEDPTVPPTEPVPEPSFDVPTEVRAALVRQVERLEGCPATAHKPVRVTLTIAATGKVEGRHVLSEAGNGEAHQCVSRALDKLILPPLSKPATVTVDVTW